MNQLKNLKDRLPGRDRAGGSSGSSSGTLTGLGLRTKASTFVAARTPALLAGSSSASYSSAPARPLRDPGEFAAPPKRAQQQRQENRAEEEENDSRAQQPALPPRRQRAVTDSAPLLACTSSPDLPSAVGKRAPPPLPPKRLHSHTGGAPPPLPPRLPPRRGTLPMGSIYSSADLRSTAGAEPPNRRRPPPAESAATAGTAPSRALAPAIPLASAYALAKEAEARHPGAAAAAAAAVANGNGNGAARKWGVIDAGEALLGKKPPVGARPW
ncbi:hypothetical protein EV426DRAFT_711839 [Tirmania nivea]|nr:hypothetical protein EV426DRAFT_711839 [Tirmania nivea]